MCPLIVYNGKILTVNSKLAASTNCCCQNSSSSADQLNYVVFTSCFVGIFYKSYDEINDNWITSLGINNVVELQLIVSDPDYCAEPPCELFPDCYIATTSNTIPTDDFVYLIDSYTQVNPGNASGSCNDCYNI